MRGYRGIHVALVIGASIALAWVDAGRGAPPATQDVRDGFTADRGPSPAELESAALELGDPDFRKREAAERTLWLAGPQAEPLLRKAARSDDPEVSLRARCVLQNIALGILPDTSPRVAELLAEYRDGSNMRRSEIVRELAAVDSNYKRTLGRLWIAEKNPVARQSIFGPDLSNPLTEWAQAMIADGVHEGVDQLLRVPAWGGDEQACRCASAWFLETGRLDAQIADARKEVALHPSKALFTFLTYAERTKGDLAQAGRDAAAAGLANEVADLAVERGDWRAAADTLSHPPNPAASMSRQARLAAYYRLAGDPAHFQAILHALASADLDREDVLKIYFLNDLPARGMDHLLHDDPPAGAVHRVDSEAVSLLCAQWRFRDAEERARKGENGASAALLPLAASLYRFGAREKAAAIFEEVRAGAQARKSFADYRALAWAYRELGQSDRVRRICLEAQKTLEGNGWSRRLIYLAVPSGLNNPVEWWDFMRRLHPLDSPEATLDRLDTMMAGKLAPQEARQLLAQAASSAPIGAFHDGWLQTLFQLAGKYSIVDPEMERQAGSAQGPGPWLAAGDVRAQRKQWSLAASDYEHAWRNRRPTQPLDPLLLALRGHALEQAGDANLGAALRRRAHEMVLGGDDVRAAFIAGLERHGLTDDAREERAVWLRLCALNDPEAGQQLRAKGIEIARANPLAAADVWDRWLVRIFRDGNSFTSAEGYLVAPHRIHEWRAKGLDAKADPGGALAQWRLCLAYFPCDSDAAAGAVADLLKLGREKESDALYADARARMQALCDDYPDSPVAHNSLAWLAARCRRDSAMAMAHATKATQLDPTSAAYLDTLAEAHLASGDRQGAVKLIEQCIKMEPADPEFKQRLNEVEGNPNPRIPKSESNPK